MQVWPWLPSSSEVLQPTAPSSFSEHLPSLVQRMSEVREIPLRITVHLLKSRKRKSVGRTEDPDDVPVVVTFWRDIAVQTSQKEEGIWIGVLARSRGGDQFYWGVRSGKWNKSGIWDRLRYWWRCNNNTATKKSIWICCYCNCKNCQEQEWDSRGTGAGTATSASEERKVSVLSFNKNAFFQRSSSQRRSSEIRDSWLATCQEDHWRRSSSSVFGQCLLKCPATIQLTDRFARNPPQTSQQIALHEARTLGAESGRPAQQRPCKQVLLPTRVR